MTTTRHTYTMRGWSAGCEDDTGTYNEFAVEVEFAADVMIYRDFDGDWQEVLPETVEIESVNVAGLGDILNRMDVQELESLRERCAEFAQGRG